MASGKELSFSKNRAMPTGTRTRIGSGKNVPNFSWLERSLVERNIELESRGEIEHSMLISSQPQDRIIQVIGRLYLVNSSLLFGDGREGKEKMMTVFKDDGSLDAIFGLSCGDGRSFVIEARRSLRILCWRLISDSVRVNGWYRAEDQLIQVVSLARELAGGDRAGQH